MVCFVCVARSLSDILHVQCTRTRIRGKMGKNKEFISSSLKCSRSAEIDSVIGAVSGVGQDGPIGQTLARSVDT